MKAVSRLDGCHVPLLHLNLRRLATVREIHSERPAAKGRRRAKRMAKKSATKLKATVCLVCLYIYICCVFLLLLIIIFFFGGAGWGGWGGAFEGRLLGLFGSLDLHI